MWTLTNIATLESPWDSDKNRICSKVIHSRISHQQVNYVKGVYLLGLPFLLLDCDLEFYFQFQFIYFSRERDRNFDSDASQRSVVYLHAATGK
jgi:hypothetical protein